MSQTPEVSANAERFGSESGTTYFGRLGLQRLIHQLCELGLVEVIGNIISSKDNPPSQKEEAVKLIIGLLLGGNPKVQDAFFDYMIQDQKNSFLVEL